MIRQQIVARISLWQRFLCVGLITLAALVSATQAHAHAVGTSYLHIEAADVDRALPVRVALSIRDLEFAVGLDVNDDARITWGEVLANQASLTAYVQRKVELRRGGIGCAVTASDLRVATYADELYAVLSMHAVCPVAGALQVQSDLLFEIDDSHRSLLTVSNDSSAISVLTSANRTWSAGMPSGAWRDFLRFVGQGVWHIWIGFDHLAFLLLLLLPLAGSVETNKTGLGLRIKEIVKVVTAFTIAHSITLICASLGFLTFSSQWIEAIIAGSIVIAALANMTRLAAKFGLALAFGFGLVHGFGFAGALADISTSTVGRAVPLLGFNLGVEIGQLVVVAAIFPALFLWRAPAPMRARAILAGSIVIGAAGVSWLVERTLLA
jgi:hypothetical protein